MPRKIELKMCKKCDVLVVDVEEHDALHHVRGLGRALYDSRELADAG
ncbi:MAG: hypothetical protein HYT80_00140 [Euryarchaeota archaeon]|nr:hypothetical protein [Euryarchaeota archaeon]